VAKRIQHIAEDFDYHYSIIGLASDDPIWKLCWQINQNLNLDLKKGDIEKLYGAEDPELASDFTPAIENVKTLFEGYEFETPQKVVDYYEDLESAPRREFALFEHSLRPSPKEAKVFRYFFLIRSPHDPPGDLEGYLEKLNAIPSILYAVDITGIRNIKQIIP
jgi:hypothetical protein